MLLVAVMVATVVIVVAVLLMVGLRVFVVPGLDHAPCIVGPA